MKFFVFFILFIFSVNQIKSQEFSNPSKHWMAFSDPAEAGFDIQLLNQLKAAFKEQEGAALLIIRDGKVVCSEGNTTRRFRQASIRKSYLNALYGKLFSAGKLDLNQSLGQLGIDDLAFLTDTEKQATIKDLLQSRSGIYLPAAYSPTSMEENLPKRGSHLPGAYWFYNNWDFNTLGTIYNQLSGSDIFLDFKNEIAGKLQFEDFNLEHTKYLKEEEKSIHPAYLFRMSARDMARFGLLYLDTGNWNGTQIINGDWIEQSFTKHTNNREHDSGLVWDDYGMLWWISNQITSERVVYAAGSGDQRIILFPESDIVIVHLTDTYQFKGSGKTDVESLVRMLLEAKSGLAVHDPKLVEYNPPQTEIPGISLSEKELKIFEGSYFNPRLGKFNITPKQNALLMEAGIGNFLLKPTGINAFINEDILIPVEFIKSSDENEEFTVKPVMDQTGFMEKIIFYYKN